jgi:hypothetical protein
MEIQPEIINYLRDFIDKYRMRENANINVKVTLGKYSEQFGFEDHLFQKDKYTEIKTFLESCSTWENTNAYNTKSKSKSKSYEIDKIIFLCKTGTYDIMISINEIINENMKMKINEKMNEKINEDSEYVISFKKKNHTFNLCEIKTHINEIYYKFNIVSIIPKDYSSMYIGHSSLLKICDILLRFDTTIHFTPLKI